MGLGRGEREELGDEHAEWDNDADHGSLLIHEEGRGKQRGHRDHDQNRNGTLETCNEFGSSLFEIHYCDLLPLAPRRRDKVAGA